MRTVGKNGFPESKTSYRWVFGLGMLVIAIIVFMAISFFVALRDNELLSKNQLLNRQVELAGKEIQKNFGYMVDDMWFFVNNLEPDTYESDYQSQLAFEKRTRRIFNNYRDIIDTVTVLFPRQTVTFYFDNKENFVKKHENRRTVFMEEGYTNRAAFRNKVRDCRIGISFNLQRFLENELGNYYLGPEGSKLLFVNGEIRSFFQDSYLQKFELESQLISQIASDVGQGVMSGYRGKAVSSENGKNVDVLVFQYPFVLPEVKGEFSVIFVLDISSLSSSFLGAYFLLMLGLLVLLGVLILLLYQYSKNSQLANQTLEKNALEIEELFRRQTLLLQESKGFIYFQDPNGKMTKVGDEVKEVLGYTPEYFLEHFRSFISEEDNAMLGNLVKESVKQKKDIVSVQFHFKKSDGKTIRVKIFEKLLYNSKGEFLGNVGICTDIQEKYESEQEIINSENRLRRVLESLPDIIIIYDRDGYFRDYYVQDESLLLVPGSKAMGKHIKEIIPSPLSEEIMEMFKKTVETGEVQTMQFELPLTVGKRFFETRIFKLDDTRIMTIGRDITSQKVWEKGLQEAMEAAESASRAKSEFLANMSHEIRTPMNALLGIVSLMENTPLTERQMEYLRVIKDSGKSLSNIINDILDYSKIESGKLELKDSSFLFKQEIQNIFNMFSAMVNEKQLVFTYRWGALMPEVVRLDKEKLRQVLVNIIGNAVKFTPQGGTIQVEISVETLIGQTVMLNFSVKDSGIGIPESKIPFLTEPFMQADGSDTREHQGTGLGLAISKKLIEVMGGELKIESTLGKGSVFSFNVLATIPADNEKSMLLSGPATVPDRFSPVGMAIRYPLTILIAEDNSTNLKFMDMLMEQLGYSYALARNGEEALEAVQRKQFDVVLMDIQMPKMNGLQATALIRKQFASSNLKIIGLSANAFQEDIQIAIDAGMDGYLAKPVDLEQVGRALEKVYKEIHSKGTVN